MIEQSSIIAILTLLATLWWGWHVNHRSEKAAKAQTDRQDKWQENEKDREDQRNTVAADETKAKVEQQRLTTAAERKRDKEDKRYHNAVELLMIPVSSPPDDSPVLGEWTKDQLESIRSTFQEAIAEVTDKLTAVANRLNTTVTTAQYMDHEAVLFKAVADGASIRDEIKGAISSYQEEGVDPDEIQRRILTAIGEGLLQMAKTPVPPAFPVRDYGITDLDTEEEQING